MGASSYGRGKDSEDTSTRGGTSGLSGISSRHIHRLQRRHFFLFDILPATATLAAIALLPVQSVSTIDLSLLAGLWLFTGLGLTTGFHRLFSHRAFATNTPVAVALIILGSMAARGSMISWVSIHRRHHQFSDRSGDLHSPQVAGTGALERLRGWLHAHEGWLLKHDYPNPVAYAPDLLRQPVLMKANRYYYRWVALGLAIPALAGGLLSMSWLGAATGVLWGGLVRLFVVGQCMSVVNSCLHLFGSRPFASADNSRNSALLALPLWGEAWHNNHHAFPYSAAFGLRWYQVDPGFWLIKALELCGLAWNIKLPDSEDLARRRLPVAT